MIRIIDIHMNPHLYPNPEDFNPENFSAKATRLRSKYSHLPHSLGIRDCIGYKYTYFLNYIFVVFWKMFLYD